jgi:hypothetical protein
MSEAITAYTTTDAVRGAIGLTPSDLPDSVLTGQQLGLELEADLLEWLGTHATLYAAGMASGATATAKLIAAQIQLYAQWYCASSVINQMVLGIPFRISDGKSEMQRFDSVDLEDLAMRVNAKRDTYRNLLAEGQGQTAVTSASIMQSGIPDYDPVTG